MVIQVQSVKNGISILESTMNNNHPVLRQKIPVQKILPEQQAPDKDIPLLLEEGYSDISLASGATLPETALFLTHIALSAYHRC